MRFPRIRYSLRTLLLASLLAGGMMMVWRVREPWTLRVWPIKSLPSKKDGPEPQLLFSQNGSVLLLQQDLKPFSNRPPICVLDTATGHEFDLTGPCTFAPERRFLICDLRQTNDPKFVVFDTLEKRVAREIPASDIYGNCLLSPDERLIYYVSSSLDPTLACMVLMTGEPLWHRPLSRDIDSVELNWDNADMGVLQVTVKTTRFGGRNIADAEIDRAFRNEPGRTSTSWELRDAATGKLADATKWFNHNKAAEKEIDDIAKTSARELDEKIAVFIAGKSNVPPPPSDLKTNLARDGSWRFVMKTDSGAITISDAKNSRELFVLHAPNAMLRGPVEVSDDKLRIAECFDPNSLAIWSRTRQHFEWWGLYERPETWLAFALLSAFLWSVLRDWRTRAAK